MRATDLGVCNENTMFRRGIADLGEKPWQVPLELSRPGRLPCAPRTMISLLRAHPIPNVHEFLQPHVFGQGNKKDNDLSTAKNVSFLAAIPRAGSQNERFVARQAGRWHARSRRSSS